MLILMYSVNYHKNLNKSYAISLTSFFIMQMRKITAILIKIEGLNSRRNGTLLIVFYSFFLLMIALPLAGRGLRDFLINLKTSCVKRLHESSKKIIRIC